MEKLPYTIKYKFLCTGGSLLVEHQYRYFIEAKEAAKSKIGTLGILCVEIWFRGRLLERVQSNEY